MSMKKLIFVFIAAVFVLSSCASKATVKDTPGGQSKSSEGTHIVRSGDTLWDIAGRDHIYGDPFRWPLLYKANRDQIDDPDLIEVDQDLDVKKNFSSGEISEAIEKAKNTPPYRAHKEPRRKLPLQY